MQFEVKGIIVLEETTVL